MENNQLSISQSNTLEQVIINGDLSKLTPAERVNYYRLVCESIGLNPFTKPFDYIQLNGKLTLYAKKDATDQLRAKKSVSIDDVDISEVGDNYVVKVKGHDSTGRCDVEIGVVKKSDMQGNSANAQMKAVTKAKRRLTLSLCGLGWLDETEIETIPDAKTVVVSDDGQIQPATVEQKVIEAPSHADAKFDEATFLKNFNPQKDFVPLPLDEAKAEKSAKEGTYGTMSTEQLYRRLSSIAKRIRDNDMTSEESSVYLHKLAAIQTVLLDRKVNAESIQQ